MPDDESNTVGDLGEFGLIDRFRSRIGTPDKGEVWSGDDAAIVSPPAGEILFTTDVLVEGIDFDLGYASGGDVGWKTMASNVSDVAAMGGRPAKAVATLCVGRDITVALIDDLLDGILEACERWRVGLVGGDVSEAERLSLGIALLGSAERPVLRSGAMAGDLLCVTGALGGAAGGLLALRNGIAAEGLKRRQLRPVARVEEGVAAARAGATAMIDISDGLAADLGHLVAASGVGCDVDTDSIPVDPALAEVAELIDPLEAALAGGEDLELLFTIPESSYSAAESAVKGIGTQLSRIGTITDGEARIGDSSIDRWKEEGWQHLRNP